MLKVVKLSFCSFMVLLMISAVCVADTILVRQDGSGDFTTIMGALSVAVDGDIVDIGFGTYNEEVIVSVSCQLLGSSGAAATIIDGLNAFRTLMITGAAAVEVSGLTLTHGLANSGGALFMNNASMGTFVDCVLINNYSIFDGGGFYVRDTGSHLSFTNCEILGNHADHNGGAGNVVLDGNLSLEGCHVAGNTCNLLCSGVASDHSTMSVRSSLFLGNETADAASAVYYYQSEGLVRSCTFYGNSAPGTSDAGGTICIQDSPKAQVILCIIAEDLTGHGLRIIGEANVRYCNLLWGNHDGPIIGDSLRDDEIEANPLFCDEGYGVFTIYNISPAAAENNDCGLLIGAFDVGCTITPTAPSSWSKVKSLY